MIDGRHAVLIQYNQPNQKTMKHLILLIALTYTTALCAQEPDPNLFQTWYLESVYQSDATPEPYIVSEIEPPITPTLTIEPDFSLSATGACNQFPGSFAFINDETFETNAVGTTYAGCGYDEHEAFDIEYRSFLNSMTVYWITSNENGMTLTAGTPVFGLAVFHNYALSLTERTVSAFEVYPNPTQSVIHLKSDYHTISEVELFNSLGKRLTVTTDDLDSIDMSSFSPGVYYVKIIADNAAVVKRVVKE